VIPRLFAAAADGETMCVFGDGHQTRDFTYVDNVVRANLLAAEGPADRVSGQVVNVGAGARTSLLELVDAVRTVTGRPITVQHLPPREGDVRDSLASLERAQRVLGYTPQVALLDGLERTWRWTAAQPTAA
jgi:UDP-glucose 4-epimerase